MIMRYPWQNVEYYDDTIQKRFGYGLAKIDGAQRKVGMMRVDSVPTRSDVGAVMLGWIVDPMGPEVYV